MIYKEVVAKVQTAIAKRKSMVVSTKYGLGNKIEGIKLHPYIFGSDFFQYDFVWGCLPDQLVFYKFRVEDFSHVSIINELFEVSDQACYQYTSEEEFYGMVEGFKNCFVDCARPSNFDLAPKPVNND